MKDIFEKTLKKKCWKIFLKKPKCLLCAKMKNFAKKIIFNFFFFMLVNIGYVRKSWKFFERYFWKKPKKVPITHENEKFLKKKFTQFFLCQKTSENMRKSWKKFERYFWKKPKKVPITRENENFREKLFFPNFFWYFFYVEICRKLWEKVENFFKDIFLKTLKKGLLHTKMKNLTEKKFPNFFWCGKMLENVRKSWKNV